MYAMKLGFCLAIVLSDLELNLCDYLDVTIFPTKEIFDFDFSRKMENYMRWVKDDEKSGYDGKVNGVF